MSPRRDDDGNSEEGGHAPAARSCAQEARSARTRQAVYEAAVRSLDEFGYAETSVMKVQSLAGVSRGALTHQYPTKESLIVAVAQRLLDDIRHTPSSMTGPRPHGEEGYLEWLLLSTLGRFFDTPEGRALTEIFQAMRTDQSLSERLADSVSAWDAVIEAWYLRRLDAPGGDEEVREFVRVFVCFGRGMMSSGPSVEPNERNALTRALAAMAAPRIRRRSEVERAAQDAPAQQVGRDAPGSARTAAE